MSFAIGNTKIVKIIDITFIFVHFFTYWSQIYFIHFQNSHSTILNNIQYNCNDLKS